MIQLTQTPKEKRDFELDDSGVLKKINLKVMWNHFQKNVKDLSNQV